MCCIFTIELQSNNQQEINEKLNKEFRCRVQNDLLSMIFVEILNDHIVSVTSVQFNVFRVEESIQVSMAFIRVDQLNSIPLSSTGNVLNESFFLCSSIYVS